MKEPIEQEEVSEEYIATDFLKSIRGSTEEYRIQALILFRRSAIEGERKRIEEVVKELIAESNRAGIEPPTAEDILQAITSQHNGEK